MSSPSKMILSQLFVLSCRTRSRGSVITRQSLPLPEPAGQPTQSAVGRRI